MAAKTAPKVPDAVNKAMGLVAEAEGFEEPRFHVESGSNAVDGYSSLLFKVTVRNEDSSTDSVSTGGTNDLGLMVKVPDLQTQTAFNKLMFVTECAMYKSTLPAMQEIAKLQGTLPWPRCFHATADGPETSLVFENLRLKGFEMVNRRVGMDAAHCRLALSQLAKYHGAGIALLHLQPETFKAATDGLGNPFSTPEAQGMFAAMGQVTAQSMAMVSEKYPEGTVIHTKLQHLLQSFGSEAIKLLAADSEAPGTAVVHGDCHSNNMMFRYNKTSGAVEECLLIDFQLSRPGNTAMDLVTLLLPCTEKSVRDQHWEELLRGYHTELQSTLRSAGCKDPDALYSWTQFMECLRQAAPFGLMIAPAMLHAQFANKEAAEEMRQAMAEIGKMEDPAAVAAFSIPPSEQIKRRLIGIVDSLAEWDWL